MMGFARGMVSFIPLALVLLLAFFGLSQFRNGWARDQSLPIPNYLLFQQPAPRDAYVRAVDALSHASNADGSNTITRAEAALNAGAPFVSQIGTLEQGLRASPASARGWMLLAYISAKSNSALATRSADLGYMIGPVDYWLAGIRVRQAAVLWPILSSDTREMALDQGRSLWLDPMLRKLLPAQLSTPEGQQFITRAFAGRRYDLVTMNRWVIKYTAALAAASANVR